MIDGIKRILTPLASLRITVTLLLMAMVLVLAGTTAQRDMGIQDVQKLFFHSFWAKLYFHYFQPTPKAGHAYIGGWIPMPGGYTLILAMVVNLLAAHTLRFKLRWNRVGIIMIHAGLLLLLSGEMVTSLFAVESQMRIDVGGAANYAEDIRTSELAVVDTSPADHNDTVAIGRGVLVSALHSGALIRDARLPFDVKVDRFYDNSDVLGPAQEAEHVEHLATAGTAKILGMREMPKHPGTAAEDVDVPSAFVTLSKDGKDLGTYLVSVFFERDLSQMPMFRQPQEVKVGGKAYQISLRFRRYYKPYTVTLHQFTHDVFLGTDVAKDFASNITLVDPVRHVNRDIRIWMNHPLRYNGETFYQQSFANNDQTSILQIVHNPAWTWPYLACAIGALGMVIHFGMKLTSFLRRQFAPGEGTVGALRRTSSATTARAGNEHGSGKGGRHQKEAEVLESYTLRPDTGGILGTVLPLAVLAIALSIVGYFFFARLPAEQYNWDAFGKLPISFEGRVQPLQSLAINTIKILSGHEAFKDENGKPQPQAKWLLDTMTRSGHWADYKIFRVDHDQVKDALKLKPNEKYFSWNELFPAGADNWNKFQEQVKLAAAAPDNDRDLFQHQILDLYKRRNLVIRLMQVDTIGAQYALMADPGRSQQMMHQLADAIRTQDPKFIEKMQGAADMNAAQGIFRNAIMDLHQDQLTSEQRSALSDWIAQEERMMLIDRMPPEDMLYLSAPLSSAEKWAPLDAAARGGPLPEGTTAFLKIVGDYQDDKPANFNADVAAYRSRLDSALPNVMAKVDYESFFDRFDPFMICLIFYATIFLLAVGSWVIFRKPMWRAAFALLLLTWLIHTFGLVSRIYISGRPPVTNLYSSAVFIAWGAVLVAMIVELIFRKGFGLAAASVAGFASLLVAAGLSSTDGDTMKQLQAVLDTNFWLATHVVCVTYGYAATFMAGIVSIFFVLLGIFTPTLDKESGKSVGRAIYGIVCFAMLLSFVGTILGGIWADQSWGRFWGWDPKENGAVLIVLWNAMILHARWSGMVRERGMAVLAILGNIVVSWSWFGTNMLGIGLHSYGFMNSAQFWLTLWMGAQVVLAGIGLIPLRFWWSYREQS